MTPEPNSILNTRQVVTIMLAFVACFFVLMFPPIVNKPLCTPMLSLTTWELTHDYWPVVKPLLLLIAIGTSGGLAIFAERRR